MNSDKERQIELFNEFEKNNSIVNKLNYEDLKLLLSYICEMNDELENMIGNEV